MEIKYQEHSMEEVTDFFAKAFRPTNNQKVVRHEAFVIPDQKKVIFKLYVEPVIDFSAPKCETTTTRAQGSD